MNCDIIYEILFIILISEGVPYYFDKFIMDLISDIKPVFKTKIEVNKPNLPLQKKKMFTVYFILDDIADMVVTYCHC